MNLLLSAWVFVKDNKHIVGVAIFFAVFGAMAISIGSYVQGREDYIREHTFAQCSIYQEDKIDAALRAEIDKILSIQEAQNEQQEMQREKTVRIIEGERRKTRALINKIKGIENDKGNICGGINSKLLGVLNRAAEEYNANSSK